MISARDYSPSPAVCCAHCGLAVATREIRPDDATQFCCAGCRQVFTLVHEWGFDQYYRLIGQQRASLEPARVSGRGFQDFDDEAVQRSASDEVPGQRRRTRLYLENVHCAACVWLVEKLPSALAGVDEVRLNYGSAVADVTWHPARTRLSTVARALDRLGYTPHVHRASQTQAVRRSEDRATLARLGVAVACAMNLMFVSGALYAGDASGMASPYQSLFRWFSLVIFAPVLVFSARPFFQTAVAGLQSGMVHIDLPIALGVAVGAIASAVNVIRGTGALWFDSLAMLVAALLAARQLQRSAQRAALERADSLRGVAFLEFARRIEGDAPGAPAIEVPLSALSPGDRVEVLSGELIPVDGVVLSGQSMLDNAVLTGEAVPVRVGEGDAVNAGATNLGARLIVRVDAAGEGTRVGALLAIVQQALARKPRVLQMTDGMARRFVYALLTVAAVAGTVIWMQSGPDVALARVVALLVVSCPCALGLSVPLAMSVALMRAARAGIFIKNPDAFVRLRDAGIVLLDKTGTLTVGRATVARWQGPPHALDAARALEEQSSHPIARAFQSTAGRSLHVVRSVRDVNETASLGIAGRVDGLHVLVGNQALVTASGAIIPADIERAAASMIADGYSPVFVAVSHQVTGVAGIGDALRDDAAATVVSLQQRGVRVRILSGDHPAAVERIGAQLGLPAADAIGGLSPEAKRDEVSRLIADRQRSGAVVMVGDGVNDAAALALADVGIAVQGGTGATIVAADVVFTRAGVRPLLDLFDGAQRVRSVIGRNVTFSLLYNLSASSLAIAGAIGPLFAAVLMPASSMVVVLSSALTRTFARPARRQKGAA